MKPKPSKLDRYADQLAELAAENKTLDEIVAWLKAEGCSVSRSRVSEFLERQRADQLQNQLLGQIANGARQCAEVEKQFAKNPAPELETLIKLQRVLIMKLSTQANADPAMLELLAGAFKSVMVSEQIKIKREEVALAKNKFEFDASKSALQHAAELQTISRNSKLSETEKVNFARQKLFGLLPK